MSADPSGARIDHVLRTLANEHRRHALSYLREHGDATEAELTDVLTGWLAADRGTGTAGPDDRDRIATELKHIHLPMLTAADLVTRDADAGVVHIVDLPEWIERCLDAALKADSHRETETADLQDEFR